MKQLVYALVFASALAAQPHCAIRGTVVDALTSRALARTQVFAELDSDSDNDSAPPVRQITDLNGAFCFDTLVASRYKVRANRAFYIDAAYGEHWSGDPGANVDVSVGKPVPPITIRMTPEASISGVLVDGDGDPLQGAPIELLRRQWKAARLTKGTVQETKTDDQGRYRFVRLVAGTYFISATPVAASSEDEALPTQRRFLDQDRQPFRQVKSKTYYTNSISFRDATPIQVSAGQEISRLTLTLRTTEARHVSGQVPPLALITSPRILWCLEKDSGNTGVAFSIPIQNDGHFLADGLPPSRYAIWGPAVAGKEIDLIEGDIDDLLLKPNEPVEVQITMHIEGASSQAPIRNLELVQTVDSGQGRASASAQFVSENRFKAVVRPGNFQISLGGDGPDYFTKGLTVDGEPQPRVFTLDAGAPRSVELFLSANIASIDGSISGDEALGNKTTLLIEEESDLEWHQSKLTVRDRKFQLNLLHSGKYRLYAFEDFKSEWWGNPELRALLADRSVAVEIKEGQHRHVSLPLISADAFQAALRKTGF